MSAVLKEMPNIRTEYVKALGSLSRKPRGEIRIPAMELSLATARVDQAQLKAYRAICGFTESDVVPITYPQVLGAALQMRLMTSKEFPLPLLGLVHLRNRITQVRALRVDEEWSARIVTGEGRPTDKGLEVDITTSLSEPNGRTLWTCVATVLYRGKPAGSRGGAAKKPAPEPATLSGYRSFNAPADIGRRYGKISGDMNPIHLYPLTAKLFGFPRAIAHGMWSLARCVALLEPELGRSPLEVENQFRLPLLLPGRVALRYQAGREEIGFALLNRDNGKPHLAGTLR